MAGYGGAGSSGEGDGRHVVGWNTALAGAWISGAGSESLLGLARGNPFITDATVETPLIAGLADGAETFGILPGISPLAPVFDAARTGAPPGARAAIPRLDAGPPGFDEAYLGRDRIAIVLLAGAPRRRLRA
ncbi:MAG: hypothetical protein R3F35_08585 [Myxococcota bacterium]